MKIPISSTRWRAWFYPLLILGLAVFVGPVQAAQAEGTQAEGTQAEGTEVNGEESLEPDKMPNLDFSILEDGRIKIVGSNVDLNRIKAFLFEGQDVTAKIKALETEGKLEIRSETGKIRKVEDGTSETPEGSSSSFTSEDGIEVVVSNEVLASIPIFIMTVDMDIESLEGRQFGFLLDNGVSLTKTIDFEPSRVIAFTLPFVVGYFEAFHYMGSGGPHLGEPNYNYPERPQMPGGSYANTCKNIELKLNKPLQKWVVSADCEMFGNWRNFGFRHTSHDANCLTLASDYGGQLFCDYGQPNTPFNPPSADKWKIDKAIPGPAGSYRNSCKDFRLVSGAEYGYFEFSALCKDRNGNYQKSTVGSLCHPQQDIQNNNGKLECVKL